MRNESNDYCTYLAIASQIRHLSHHSRHLRNQIHNEHAMVEQLEKTDVTV